MHLHRVFDDRTHVFQDGPGIVTKPMNGKHASLPDHVQRWGSSQLSHSIEGKCQNGKLQIALIVISQNDGRLSDISLTGQKNLSMMEKFQLT